MAAFPSKKFRSANPANNSLASRYRAMMAKRPFLLFGLPFMSVIVAGSFVLTPATAIRYEKHDRRVRQMTRDEELGVRGKNGRKVNIKDEYYVSFRFRGYFSADLGKKKKKKKKRGVRHCAVMVEARRELESSFTDSL